MDFLGNLQGCMLRTQTLTGVKLFEGLLLGGECGL